MPSIVSIKGVGKTYNNDVVALKTVDLEIERGEIFALLGPNGAGKTTLIGIICGIVTMSKGTIVADGHDIVKDFRAARSKIGLVPQELSTDAFETVWSTVSFSRGLFGKKANPAHIEKVLRALSLWDKKDNRIIASALYVQEQYPPPTVLVTKDVNVQLKARAVGLESQDYDAGDRPLLASHGDRLQHRPCGKKPNISKVGRR